MILINIIIVKEFQAGIVCSGTLRKQKKNSANVFRVKI